MANIKYADILKNRKKKTWVQDKQKALEKVASYKPYEKRVKEAFVAGTRRIENATQIIKSTGWLTAQSEKDRLGKVILGTAQAVGWAGEQIFSPVTWLLTPSTPLEEGEEWSGFMKGVANVMEFGWRVGEKATKTYFWKWSNELLETAGKNVWWDTIIWWGILAGWKAIWLWAKAVKNVSFKKIDRATVISEYKDMLDKKGALINMNTDTLQKSTEVFDTLMQDIWSGISKKDLIKKTRDYGINPEFFTKKLNEVTDANYLKARWLDYTFQKIKAGIKNKTATKIETKLNEIGYATDPDFAKSELRKQWYSQSDIDKTENWMKQRDEALKTTDARVLKNLLDLKELKAKSWDELGYDTKIDRPIWEAYAYWIRNGLLKRVKGAGKSEWLDSFQYTEKWIQTIRDNWLQYDRFDAHITNWLWNYRPEKFDGILKDYDNNTIISPWVVDDLMNDLSWDVEMKSIDSSLFDLYSWENVDYEAMANNFGAINRKYWTNFNVEDIRAWKIEWIEKQFDQLRKNEFITVDKLKNPAKAVNVSSSIGLVKRIFKDLRKWVNDIDASKPIKGQLDALKTTFWKKAQELKRNLQWKELALKSKLLANKADHLRWRMEIIARSQWVEWVKQEILKNLKELPSTWLYKWNIQKVISDVTDKSFWKDIKTPNQLKKVVDNINKRIAVEHARWLVKEIKTKLKANKVNQTNSWYKSSKMNIEQLMQLQTANELFGKMKYWELDIKELEDLLGEIDAVIRDGKSIKLAKNQEKTIEVNTIVKQIEPDVRDLRWTKDKTTTTMSGKIADLFSSYDNALLEAPRLIKKIFGNSKIATDYFILRVERAWNSFQSFEEKYTKWLANTIDAFFNGSKEATQEWTEFMLARRRSYTPDGKVDNWSWLDRLMADKTSKFAKKTDKYSGIEKPEYWNELPDDVWNQIRQTELAGTMLKYWEYEELIKIWDGFHNITGTMANKVRTEIDNKFLEAEPYYFPIEYLSWPKSWLIDEIGVNASYKSTINPPAFKKTSKNVKGDDIVMNKNVYSLLYGNHRMVRYYTHMQEAHKDMFKLYMWDAKSVKAFSIDEINGYMKDGYSFRVGTSEVEVLQAVEQWGEIMLDVNMDVGGKIERAMVRADDATIKMGEGLEDYLTPEARYRLKNYVDRVARAGNTAWTTRDKAMSITANHFNRLPMMGSLSVVAKQPLSIIDAGGKVGYRNLSRAEKDLWTSPWIDDALNDIPSISNRAWDLQVKELTDALRYDGVWFKVVRWYEKYGNIMMKPIQIADKFIYKKIWLASLRKRLVEKGDILANENITPEMIRTLEPDDIAYADDMTNSVTATNNPLMAPQIYDTPWSKALFGIFTTQLNRIHILTRDVPEMWKEWSKKGDFSLMNMNDEHRRAIITTASLMTSNIAEVAVTIWIGKLTNELGISNWEWYDEDFMNQMISMDTAWRTTFWQFFAMWRLGGLIMRPEGGLSPASGGIYRALKDANKIADWIISDDKEWITFENLMKLWADTFWGKPMNYLQTKMFSEEK